MLSELMFSTSSDGVERELVGVVSQEIIERYKTRAKKIDLSNIK
jgi:hypothetical protein